MNQTNDVHLLWKIGMNMSLFAINSQFERQIVKSEIQLYNRLFRSTNVGVCTRISKNQHDANMCRLVMLYLITP